MSVKDKYRIIGDWLLVAPEPEQRVVGGIALPDTAVPIIQKGEVVNVKDGDLVFKLHDSVLFKRRAAFKKIEIDHVDYLVMKPRDVLGILFGEHATDVAPLRDGVLLEWEEAEEVHHGTNIIRPDSHREMYFTGVVTAIGPDVKEVVCNDRVFWDQFCSPDKFEEDGKRYAFIREENIVCKNLPVRVPA